MACKSCGGGSNNYGVNQTAKSKFIQSNDGVTITVSDGTKLLIDSKKQKAIKLS